MIESPVPAEGRTPSPDAGIVRAFAPPGGGRHAVVSWARRHARRTGARIEILVDSDPEAPPAPGIDIPGGVTRLFGGLLEQVRGLFREPSSLTARLGRASAGARMLVVPQALPGVEVLVDTAYEPVTVVPTDPPHAQGAVVLALAHRTTDETIEAAFEAADQRGAPILVLHLRDPDRWMHVTTDDPHADQEREDCADRLSAWRIIHSTVAVEVRIGAGDPTVELVRSTYDARLLVIGRSARGRFLSTLPPSPVAPVVQRTRCPVLVVPPPGPPRHSWWPRA